MMSGKVLNDGFGSAQVVLVVQLCSFLAVICQVNPGPFKKEKHEEERGKGGPPTGRRLKWVSFLCRVPLP